MPVGLETLEDLLAVVQYSGGGIQGNGPVRLNARVVPAAVALFVNAVIHDGGVVAEVVAEPRVGQDGCTLFS